MGGCWAEAASSCGNWPTLALREACMPRAGVPGRGKGRRQLGRAPGKETDRLSVRLLYDPFGKEERDVPAASFLLLLSKS